MLRLFVFGVIIILLLAAACTASEPETTTIAGSTAIATTQTTVPTETTFPTQTPTEAATATATAEPTLEMSKTPEPAATSTEAAAVEVVASPIDRLAEAANITVVDFPGAPENPNPIPIWFGDQPIPWGIEITDMEEFSRLIFQEWLDNLIIPVLQQSTWTHEEFQPYRDLYTNLEDKSEAAVREALVARIREEGFVRLPWLEWDGWYPGVTELPIYGPPVQPTMVRANLDFTVEVLSVDKWDSNYANTFSPDDLGLVEFPQNLLWYAAGSAIMFDGTSYQILAYEHAGAAATAAKPLFIKAFTYFSWATRRAILGNDATVMSPEALARYIDVWLANVPDWGLATVRSQ